MSVYTMGAVTILPSVGLEYRHDDNIFSANQGQKASDVGVANSSIAAKISNDISEGALLYSVEKGTYQSSPEDDYLDQRAGLGFHHAFRRWAIIDLALGQDQLHEARGQGYSQGKADLLPAPDLYVTDTANFLFRLGTRRSQGMFESQLAGTSLRYTTREAQTAGRNNDYISGRLTYHFNLSSKTSLLAETRYGQYDYINETSLIRRDSSEQHYYLGLSWELSSLSRGSIRVGQQKKIFVDQALMADSSNSWEMKLFWKPTPLASIKFGTSAKNQESVGMGSHVYSEAGFFAIKNSLTKRLGMDMSTQITKNSYRPSGRNELLGAVAAKVIYSSNRWIHLDFGIDHEQRRSDQAMMNYRRSIVSMGIRISPKDD
ncbi:MAG: outer membrane beta-barrel protein [Gammaproteobacteria bacterium]|nr:outer membrane beta-barrel protein [Gammaproteobacteria bacterium]